MLGSSSTHTSRNRPNQSLQPTANRRASTLFMTKTVLEVFSHASGSRG